MGGGLLQILDRAMKQQELLLLENCSVLQCFQYLEQLKSMPPPPQASQWPDVSNSLQRPAILRNLITGDRSGRTAVRASGTLNHMFSCKSRLHQSNDA
jgi:hypothetical protein